MEQLNIYRTALDALYFLLTQLPDGPVTDFSRVVLDKSSRRVLENLVSDVFAKYRLLFDVEKSE